jgi:esterase/lipase superfamily enzyme
MCFQNRFDGFYDDQVYFHSPSHYLPGTNDGPYLQSIREMEIVLTIGRDDPFYQKYFEFSEILWEKGIWQALHEWEGRAHSGRYWRDMVGWYL